MPAYNLVVIVTLLALILYLHMGVRVAAARGKHGVAAPAVTGSPEFERAYRVQMNTLEWLPLFLPSLWLFAAYWNQFLAAALGLVWILGRMLYMTSYTKDPAGRGPGFGIQALATLILLLGALGKAVWTAANGGV
jgi:glutathione S-transferase